MNLSWYPELQAKLADIFDMKVSLIDLAKLLEKDLLIFEYEKDKYKLAFKTEMLGNHSMNITINEDIESFNQ